MKRRPETLAAVSSRRSEGDEAYRIALVQFLDDFYVNPARRQATIDPAPPETGVGLQDAMRGPSPNIWRGGGTSSFPPGPKPGFRYLQRPYFATPIEALKATLLAQSPIAFRHRMIFVEHEPLRRARMPV